MHPSQPPVMHAANDKSQHRASVAVSRRHALQSILLAMPAAGAMLLCGKTERANAARSLEYPELRGLDDTVGSVSPAPFRAQDGIKMQDINEGTGASVEDGRVVSVKYVLRRSNGYFVDASYGFDRFDTYSFRAGSGTVVEGFERGVRGMREGGRRRFVVPPSLGYGDKPTANSPGPIPPGFGPRRALASHSREPLIFEVLVVKVR